jgi:hypothetical protein
MTAGQRQAAISFGSIIKEWMPAVGGTIAVIYFFVKIVSAIGGPIKMGTQVDLTSMGTRVTALEDAQKVAAATQTAMVDEIRNTKTAIIDKINAMPRPTDYSDQSAHLSKLDDRMGKQDVATADLSARVSSIEGQLGRQPYRNPQGRQN